MPSTYSSRLRLELMASGEQSGSWGTKTNTNLGTLIEEAIAGYTTKALSDANYTLSTANGATDEARQMMLKFTGTLTANRNITVPTSSKLYFVENATTGGFSLTFKTASGTGIEVLSGEKAVLYCDGTNVLDAITRRPGYNAIINGDMNIAQRGTSFVSPTTNTYNLDRYFFSYSTAGVVTITQSTDVPTVAQAGLLFMSSLDIQVTTIDSSVAASDRAVLFQAIEGYNWIPLAQRVITFSTWVKAKKTGIYCLNLTNSGSDRSYVAEFTINAADTWEYKTITIPASPSAGTWNYTNGAGLYVGIVLLAGSTFQTTANAWQTGNFRASANQVNALDSVSNYVRMTGWRLEPGSIATISQPKSYDAELLACYRYYVANLWARVGGGATPAVTGRSWWCVVQHPIQMRTTPTATKGTESLTNMNAGTVTGINTMSTQYTATNSVANDCVADTYFNLSAEL